MDYRIRSATVQSSQVSRFWLKALHLAPLSPLVGEMSPSGGRGGYKSIKFFDICYLAQNVTPLCPQVRTSPPQVWRREQAAASPIWRTGQWCRSFDGQELALSRKGFHDPGCVEPVFFQVAAFADAVDDDVAAGLFDRRQNTMPGAPVQIDRLSGLADEGFQV